VSLALAWAAGFFDGEGSTGTYASRHRPTAVRIFASVTQAASSSNEIPAVLARFQSAVGGLGRVSGAYLDRRYGAYIRQWRTSSFEETQAVVALLWGSLSDVKRVQARDALIRYVRQYEHGCARYRRPDHPRVASMPRTGNASASDLEFAWAAGLFDGEGSTELHRRRSGDRLIYAVRTRVSQCGADGVPGVLARFQRSVNGRGWIEGPSARDGYADAYKWAAGNADALFVLRLLWPYLSVAKRTQASDVLGEVNTLPVVRRHAWRAEVERFRTAHAISEILL